MSADDVDRDRTQLRFLEGLSALIAEDAERCVSELIRDGWPAVAGGAPLRSLDHRRGGRGDPARTDVAEPSPGVTGAPSAPLSGYAHQCPPSESPPPMTEHLPRPAPTLHAEFQLVVGLTSGAVMVFSCESEWSARTRGRRIADATDEASDLEDRAALRDGLAGRVGAGKGGAGPWRRARAQERMLSMTSTVIAQVTTSTGLVQEIDRAGDPIPYTTAAN